MQTPSFVPRDVGLIGSGGSLSGGIFNACWFILFCSQDGELLLYVKSQELGREAGKTVRHFPILKLQFSESWLFLEWPLEGLL